MSARPRAQLGLRLKLTLVFAVAMALLFGGLELFVYDRSRADLDRSLNQGLRARAEDVRALVMQSDSGLRQGGSTLLVAPGERFAQVLTAGGRVLDETSARLSLPVLSAAERSRGAARPTLIEHASVPGAPGAARILAIPVQAQGQPLVVVVGASLRARNAALADLRAVLLWGGPVALALASLLGYALATLALRSVESMRRRAERISLTEPGQRLPVPRGGDELTRLAETLNQMLARNEAAFQRERTFVADASHELRSPLAILRAELEVALVGESSREELEHAIAAAGEEAERLSRLADDLLLLTEADRGSLPIRREFVDVPQSLERLVRRFGARARDQGGAITTRSTAGLRLRADTLRLEQALGNLLDNALRHGAKNVAVRARRDREAVVFEVADDGPGFAPAFIERAFDRFTRAEESRTHGGAGLGLAIVRSIARAHGGEAYLGNAPAGGGLVRLSIPDAPAPERRAARRPSALGSARA
jgi:two-component system, OmpR family, sensor kinase